MKHGYLSISVAAVIATAACNGGGEEANNGSAAPTTNAQQNETVSNVASGAGTPQDHAAIRKARHDHYEDMGRAMKGIGDQLKAGSPDMAVIQRHAATVHGFGPQILGWFPEGSGPESGRTRAKAEIWSDAAGFRAANERFQQASGAFNQAAQSGDLAAVRAALPALRQSCSNCHDKYRGPDDH
jgi:cytochrome c556